MLRHVIAPSRATLRTANKSLAFTPLTTAHAARASATASAPVATSQPLAATRQSSSLPLSGAPRCVNTSARYTISNNALSARFLLATKPFRPLNSNHVNSTHRISSPAAAESVLALTRRALSSPAAAAATAGKSDSAPAAPATATATAATAGAANAGVATGGPVSGTGLNAWSVLLSRGLDGRAVTVKQDTLLPAALAKMNEHKTGCLVVTDDVGNVVGLVCERDIIIAMDLIHRNHTAHQSHGGHSNPRSPAHGHGHGQDQGHGYGHNSPANGGAAAHHAAPDVSDSTLSALSHASLASMTGPFPTEAWDQMPLSFIMTPARKIVFANTRDPLDLCLALMLRGGFQHLPIIETNIAHAASGATAADTVTGSGDGQQQQQQQQHGDGAAGVAPDAGDDAAGGSEMGAGERALAHAAHAHAVRDSPSVPFELMQENEATLTAGRTSTAVGPDLSAAAASAAADAAAGASSAGVQGCAAAAAGSSGAAAATTASASAAAAAAAAAAAVDWSVPLEPGWRPRSSMVGVLHLSDVATEGMLSLAKLAHDAAAEATAYVSAHSRPGHSHSAAAASVDGSAGGSTPTAADSDNGRIAKVEALTAVLDRLGSSSFHSLLALIGGTHAFGTNTPASSPAAAAAGGAAGAATARLGVVGKSGSGGGSEEHNDVKTTFIRDILPRTGIPKNTHVYRAPRESTAKSLYLDSGAFSIPHPRKRETGGEDAFFYYTAVPSHDNGFDPQLPYSVVAIADGVSSWRYEYGIDAGAFSNALMEGIFEATANAVEASTQTTLHLSPAPANAAAAAAGAHGDGENAALAPLPSARSLLQRAWAHTTEQRRTFGSSTLCVVVLNPSTGTPLLQVRNIGDSGLMVLRPATHAAAKKPARAPLPYGDGNSNYSNNFYNNANSGASAAVAGSAPDHSANGNSSGGNNNNNSNNGPIRAQTSVGAKNLANLRWAPSISVPTLEQFTTAASQPPRAPGAAGAAGAAQGGVLDASASAVAGAGVSVGGARGGVAESLDSSGGSGRSSVPDPWSVAVRASNASNAGATRGAHGQSHGAGASDDALLALIPRYSVAFRSAPQLSELDTPFQLGLAPKRAHNGEGADTGGMCASVGGGGGDSTGTGLIRSDNAALSATAASESESEAVVLGEGGLEVDPRSAQRFQSPADASSHSVAVQEGDLVILATDGLFDNLSENDIMAVADECEREAFMLTSGRSHAAPEAVARALTAKAYEMSLSRTVDSPFAILAKESMIMWSGGRPDDITVVCSRVMRGAGRH